MDLSQYLPLLIYYLFGSIPTEKFYKKLPKKEFNNLGPILSKSFFFSISDFLKGLVGAILLSIFHESFSNSIDISYFQILCSLSIIVGTSFKIFNNFQGNDCLPAYLGIVFILYLPAFISALIFFTFLVINIKKVVLSSIVTTCFIPVFLLAVVPLLSFKVPPFSIIIISVVMPWVSLFYNRKNLKNIFKNN